MSWGGSEIGYVTATERVRGPRIWGRCFTLYDTDYR